MACSHSFIPWHAAKHDEHCQQHAITPCTQHDIVTMVCNQDKHQAAQKGTSPVLDPHAPIQAACIGECSEAPEGLQQLEIGGFLSPFEEPFHLRSGSGRRQKGFLFTSSSRLSTWRGIKAGFLEYMFYRGLRNDPHYIRYRGLLIVSKPLWCVPCPQFLVPCPVVSGQEPLSLPAMAIMAFFDACWLVTPVQAASFHACWSVTPAEFQTPAKLG
eukprot:1153088-Pelagomonas_calceolata.AAC.10